MFAKLHGQFGSAGLALSIVAIVLALGGGAYAANHATASKAKAGPRGKTGKTGPAGSPGPAGPVGLQGKEGPEGKQGPKGENGTTGFTKTLPLGETETGVWAVNGKAGTEEDGGFPVGAISFSFPLSAEIQGPEHAFFVTAAEVNGQTAPEACPGNKDHPEAQPGSLCVYESRTTFETPNEERARPELLAPPGEWQTSGVGKYGEVIEFAERGIFYTEGVAFGTWAVTEVE